MVDSLNLDALDEENQELNLEALDVEAPQEMGKAMQDRLASHAAVIANKGQNDYFRALNIALGSPDKKQQLNNTVVKKTQGKHQALDNHFRSTVEANPNSVVNATNALVTAKGLIDLESTSPISNEVAVVEDMIDDSKPTPFVMKERIKQNNAANMAMSNDLLETVDKMQTKLDKDGFGFIDKSTSFLGMFLPFNETLDLKDLFEDPNIQGITETTNIKEFILEFQSLPPERRLQYWSILKQSVFEAYQTDVPDFVPFVGGSRITDPNIPKASALLTAFLSPQGASDADFRKKLDVALGAADPVILGAAQMILAGTVNSFVKGTNLIRAHATVGNTDEATRLATQSLGGRRTSESIGIDQQEVTNIAMPIQRDEVVEAPGTVNGLAPEINRNLNALQMQIDEVALSLSQEGSLLKEGAISIPSRERRVQAEIDHLRDTSSDVLTEGFYVDNIVADGVDSVEGFKISYDIVRPGVGAPLRVRQQHKWKLDDETGTFQQTVEGTDPLTTQFGHPTFFAKGNKTEDFMGTAKSAIRVDDFTASVRSSLQDLEDNIFKPLKGLTKRGARKRADAVDLAGDEFVNLETGIRGKTFTPEELMAGVETRIGTVKLTDPKELESYYARRQYSDFVHSLENNAARRDKELKGIESYEVQGTNLFGKPFKSQEAFVSEVKDFTQIRVYDKQVGEVKTLTLDDIDILYAEGKKVVKLEKGPNDKPLRKDTPGLQSSEIVDYVAVLEREKGFLPTNVLHRREGYVIKVNEQVEFLVKKKVPAIKNGDTVDTEITERFFASKKEADEFAKRGNESQGEGTFRTVPSTQLDEAQKMEEGLTASGGLVTGARSSRDIRMGLAGVDVQRVSPLEAIQRMTAHISRKHSKNEWRLGEERKWLNTANMYFPGKYKSFSDAPNVGFSKESPKQQMLEALHSRIRLWNDIPTRQESMFESYVQSLHDWTLAGVRRVPGFKDKASVSSLLWLKHADYFQAAKSAAFHPLMGMFNPFQLFMQGSGAVVAFSRFNPKAGTLAVKDAFAMGYLDNTLSAGARRQMYRELGEGEATLLQEIHEAWGKTGLRESIRTNADATRAETNGNLSLSGFSKILDQGLFFYRAGELFNRRTSFAASYRNWKAQNPNKKPNQDEFKEILSDTNLSMLELNKANAATWQGHRGAGFFANLLGIMSQFGQVSAKAVGHTVKGSASGFSPQEKGKILFAQAALFGAAGVPISAYILNQIAETSGINTQALSPTELKALNQGITGALALDLFGVDVDISNRFSISNDLIGMWRDMLFSDAPLTIEGMGALGTVADRTLSAFSQAIPMVMTGIKSREMSRERLLFAANSFAKIASSWNNAQKGWFMHKHNRMLDRHGRDVLTPDDFTFEEEVAVALGIQLTDVSIAYDNMMTNKAVQERINNYSKAIVKLWHDWAVVEDMDTTKGQALADTLQYMFEMIDDPIVEQKVRTAVEERIFGDRPSIEERELKKVFDRLVENQYGSLVDSYNSILGPHRTNAFMQPLGPQEEE